MSILLPPTTSTDPVVRKLISWCQARGLVISIARSIDKVRLCEKIGDLNAEDIINVKRIIKEMLVD